MANRTHSDAPRVIFSSPLLEEIRRVREQASTLRALPGPDPRAELLEGIAKRMEEAVDRASVGEWVSPEDAAPLLRITPDGVRARCRRVLRDQGLARKVGGLWEVHTSALTV